MVLLSRKCIIFIMPFAVKKRRYTAITDSFARSDGCDCGGQDQEGCLVKKSADEGEYYIPLRKDCNERP